MRNTLEFVIEQFANRLRLDFAQAISSDPRGFKKQVLRLIRRQLPPRRGRPKDPRLDAAFQLVQQGKSVRQVLRTQIPGFEQLDTYGRYLAERGLREAIARRRRAKRN